MKKVYAKDNQGKKRLRAVAVTLFVIEILLSAAVLAYLLKLAVLPDKIYRIILFSLCGIAALQLFLLLLGRKRKPKGNSKINVAISSILIVALLISGGGIYYFYGKLDDINADLTKYTVLTVYSLNESSVSRLHDLSSGRVLGTRGIIDDENNKLALENITEKNGAAPKTEEFIDFADQVDALYSGKVDAILVNHSFMSLITEQRPGFNEKVKEVYSIKLEKASAAIATDIFTTKPFNIYISGVDATRGLSEITDYCNSDVNMIMSINPVTKSILLVNIPRDYYIGLNGDSSKMDKLTHAGSYGIETSMNTIEAFFGIEFSGYVKVNFKSVVNIVDALGGVDVDSELAFSSFASLSGDRYWFSVGENHLTGDSALAFSRERYSFQDGDRQRGKNQQLVINAIIQKMTSSAIITNFAGVLDAVTSNVKTSISTETLNAFLKMQLTEMSAWNISMTSVTGSDDHQVTYTGGSQVLYVMRPNTESVEEAKAKLTQNMALPIKEETDDSKK